MLKKYLSLLLFGTLVAVSHSQSRDFPDKRYEAAVKARDFVAIAKIVKEYGTNTVELLSDYCDITSASVGKPSHGERSQDKEPARYQRQKDRLGWHAG